MPSAPRGLSLWFRRGRLAGRVGEVAEEFRVGPQQVAGVTLLQAVLVGRHRPVEGEEVRVLSIGFGEQTVTLTVAGAADRFGLAVGVRDDHGRFTIGLGADFLRLL